MENRAYHRLANQLWPHDHPMGSTADHLSRLFSCRLSHRNDEALMKWLLVNLESLVTSHMFFPSLFMMKIPLPLPFAPLPINQETKAICLTSGDHVGCWSSLGWSANWRILYPSLSTINISLIPSIFMPFTSFYTRTSLKNYLLSIKWPRRICTYIGLTQLSTKWGGVTQSK